MQIASDMVHFRHSGVLTQPRLKPFGKKPMVGLADPQGQIVLGSQAKINQHGHGVWIEDEKTLFEPTRLLPSSESWGLATLGRRSEKRFYVVLRVVRSWDSGDKTLRKKLAWVWSNFSKIFPHKTLSISYNGSSLNECLKSFYFAQLLNVRHGWQGSMSKFSVFWSLYLILGENGVDIWLCIWDL